MYKLEEKALQMVVCDHLLQLWSNLSSLIKTAEYNFQSWPGLQAKVLIDAGDGRVLLCSL